ncbi:hypothetical protein [Flavobacterium beibuense]|uniref:Nmad2 family putative nucleotide modification protein n=1 Tax=Flavobacterium beibuense TaxID=657326 RepID=UPI003A9520C7
MPKLYSYVLRYDDGAAPNPYWGICTLAICKPIIRRNADIGDWVIGTGSKNTHLKNKVICDLSDCIVYAMKITDIMSLKDYDIYCNSSLPNKIPNWYSEQWPEKMGDCIYDYSYPQTLPNLRLSVHNFENYNRDLSGENVLLSNHFYYFGEDAKTLPEELRGLIKQNQGHKKIINENLISIFEEWISGFERNKLYADPQLRYEFDKEMPEEIKNLCARQKHMDDFINENEEILS